MLVVEQAWRLMGRGGWVRSFRIGAALEYVDELVLLALWTLLVTRPYLTSNPFVLPFGRDFVDSTFGHNLWVHARDCGMCALWNGDARGGAPALADPLGATMHPLVAVSTYFWGFVNGAKVVIVVSFFLTGVGQWALARVLGLGMFARLWCGAMAITAGHVVGAMSTGGLVPIVVSLSSATMLLAALLASIKRPSIRRRVLVGVPVALLLVSGQGYVQVAFALTLPVFGLIVAGDRGRTLLILRETVLAGALGALLAAPFLVPFLRFYPRSSKELTSTFESAQPVRYAVLNLVIDDWEFFRNDLLDKVAFAEWYYVYIGWPAVVLAIVGAVVFWNRGERRLAAFLTAYPISLFWLSSAALFEWLADHPGVSEHLAETVQGLRSVPLMSKLAVTPLLALAGIALDRLLRLPRVRLAVDTDQPKQLVTIRLFALLDTRIIVAPLALLVLWQLRVDNKDWILLDRPPAETVRAVTAELETPDMQWVQPPYGESIWVPDALAHGLKLAYFHRTWILGGAGDPFPTLVVSRGDEPSLMRVGSIDSLGVYRAPPGSEYAAVVHADGSRTVCRAHGTGGDIDVTCNLPQPGTLIVQEHTYPGWSSRVDDRSAPIQERGGWLAVAVPAGESVTQLRFRPADAAVGFGLMAAGLMLAAFWLWRGSSRGETQSSGAPSDRLATVEHGSTPAGSGEGPPIPAGSDQLIPEGHGDGGRAGIDLQLAEDVGDVAAGGARADEEHFGDLAVGPALREEAEHFDLAFGQPERV